MREKLKPRASANGKKVQTVHVENARRLVTLVVERGRAPDLQEDVRGAFVRVRGEPGVSREDIEDQAQIARESGAVAVKVEGAIDAPALAEEDAAEPARDETIRQAAEQVIEAMRFDGKEALAAFVDGELSRVGL